MKMKREAYVALLCAAVMLCAGGIGSTCKLSSASPSSQNTAQLSFSQSSLSLIAIDVGRGDALLLELPNGKTILVDGGVTYSAQQFVIPYLLARNITHLNAIVCTHEHSDHIDGLVALLRDGRITVDSAYDSGFPIVQNLRIANSYERASVSAYLGQLNEKKIPRTIVKAGDSIKVGRDDTLNRDVSIDVLSPNQNLTRNLQKLVKDTASLAFNATANMEAINENSLVLRISCGQVHFLLAGDTSLPGDEYADAAMLRDPAVSANLSTDVLKLGHHGFSPPDDNFYKVVQPRYVIMTYGPFLFTGAPQCEGLGEGAKNIDYFKDKLWDTCDKGTIVVTTDGAQSGIYVRSEASPVPKVCCCNCSNPSAPQYAF
jgi:competence protein ComEC